MTKRKEKSINEIVLMSVSSPPFKSRREMFTRMPIYMITLRMRRAALVGRTARSVC